MDGSERRLVLSLLTARVTIAALFGAAMLLGSLRSLAGAADAACDACIHDEVQHRFRIEGHPIFHPEQVLQERCAAQEFPRPVFRVAADGTQSSVFDVARVVEGSCGTTLTDPTPHFLDDHLQPVANNLDLRGAVSPIDRRPDYVRFEYTHPRVGPDAGEKFRVVRIGIFYVDRANPGAGERLGTILDVRVYRPPVVMIHGLWSDASAFADMEQALTTDDYEPFQLYRLDYRITNDSAFSVNYARVADGIDAVIQQSADADLAAGKVDLVTHSMGGVLSRLYVQDPGYTHEVRRIITSNTPHAGSQMANLLLDRTFDSRGLICSVLGRAMSSSALPDRGCDNGAVSDLQVSSLATTFLNRGIHPTEVAVHALTTTFDPADLPDISRAFRGAGAAPFLIARLLRGCGLSLIDAVFDSDEHDLIVAATSQAGGLEVPLTSRVPNQEHMGAVANPAVIDRVKQLLEEPPDSESFTPAGFSPDPLGYTTPSLCPFLRSASSDRTLESVAASAVAITSPAPGSIVAPGDSVTVEASGTADVATIVLVMAQPGADMILAEQPGPDARFDLEVPETALGLQNLVVAGLDGDGTLVAVSESVVVTASTPAALESISVYPPAVYVRACGEVTLEITGQYEDGVARDLSAQADLAFAFEAGHAVRSGADGVVLNEALDDTLTVTLDGVESAPVPIRALATDDPGACGATTTIVPGAPATTSTTTTPTEPTTTTTLPLCTRPGLAGVACHLTAGLVPDECAADELPDAFARQVGKAQTLVTKALAAGKPKKLRKLVRRIEARLAGAERSIAKRERAKKGKKLSASCAEVLHRVLGEVRELLATPGCDPTVGTLQLDAAAYTLSEAGGVGPAILVTRTGGSTGAVTATVTTSDGTATAGSDYTQLAAIITFGDGDAAPRTITLPIADDAEVEPDETVNLTLSVSGGCAATGTPAAAVVTIMDDDDPPPLVTYTVGGTVVGLAGSGLVLEETVTGERLTPGNGAFVFGYAFPDGSAYAVRIVTQPTSPSQVCSLSHASGTIVSGHVIDVAVNCVTPPATRGLDPTFGDRGKLTGALGGGARAVALQGDGKLVVLGEHALARYNSDATPDTSFGTGGTAAGFSGDAQNLALQPDGRIVVVGSAGSGTREDFAVARFETDGRLDTTFGTGGTVTTDFAASVARAYAVLIQGDGRIVVAGHAAVASPLGPDNDFAVARYTPSGTLDASFGTSGKVTTDIAGRTDLAHAAALQADGRIILAGRVAIDGGTDPDVGLVRYDAAGRLDPEFGANGIVRIDLSGGNWDEAVDVAIQSDGRLVVAVQAVVGTTFDFGLARFDARGSLDDGFGDHGYTTTPVGTAHDYARAVALQADGRIVLVGQTESATVTDFGIVRYDAEGTLDTTFGNNGKLTVDFFGAFDSAECVAIGGDGRVIAGGAVRNGTATELGLVRVIP